MARLDRWLFACDPCSRDDCANCVHLTRGEFCPCRCWWLFGADELALLEETEDP